LGPLLSEDVEEALMFIEVAKRDLEASKLLLENGYYPQGLFYLQQSIEKAAKAVLKALNLVDAKSLRKDIGHEILINGLKAMSSATLDRFRGQLSSMSVEGLTIFCQLLNFCPEAYEHLHELFESIKRGEKIIEEWLDKKHDKGLRTQIAELGDVIFTENADAEKKVEEFLDTMSKYVTDVVEAFKEFKLETIVMPFWKFEKAILKCFEKLPTEHNQPRRALENIITPFVNQFVDQIAKIFYVFDVLAVLASYHVLFEDKVSMLRYPDKNWTPLSISDRSVIMKASRRIINFILGQGLLDVLSDFIRGEIKRDRSRAVYEELMKYIKELKNEA